MAAANPAGTIEEAKIFPLPWGKFSLDHYGRTRPPNNFGGDNFGRTEPPDNFPGEPLNLTEPPDDFLGVEDFLGKYRRPTNIRKIIGNTSGRLIYYVMGMRKQGSRARTEAARAAVEMPLSAVP